MKVLLINPTQDNPAMRGPHKIVLNEAGIYPPCGLLHLATFEVLRGKHEVKILDSIAEGLNLEEIKKRILEEKPDVVGVTLTTLYLGDGYRIVKLVKEISKEIITVVGGPHLSLYPKETINWPDVDIAICGEAEYSFAEVLDRLSKKLPIEKLSDIPGVLTKFNYEKPACKLQIEDIDSLPIVNHRLVPYKKYFSILTEDNPVTVIMTSRGCPFNCAYCPQAGTKVRKRSAKKVADEIQQCLDMGIKDILFFDELFTLEHNRVKELCNEFLSRGLKFRWHCRTRIKDVDKEIIYLMKKAGCRLIQFGIESGTERIQKIMHKNLNLNKVREVIKMVRDAGILTYGNFMLGSPTETFEEMNKTIEFAMELKLDFAVFAVTHLIPKTEYHTMALKEGKWKEDVWEKYVRYPVEPIENIYWPDFDKNLLEKYCNNAYVRFYLRPWYIYNYIKRIMSPTQILNHFNSLTGILTKLTSRNY